MERAVYEFISQKTNDPIVEWRTCAWTGEKFPIYQGDRDFYEKIAPTFAGQTFPIPLPTLCPEARRQRRLLQRNERVLYRRKDDLTGASIISAHHPHKDYKVTEHTNRWTDAWDGKDLGRDFDTTKTFTQQFDQLVRSCVHPSLMVSQDAKENNCLYVNLAGRNKNCYLIFDSDANEDCLYSTVLKFSKDCVDCSYTIHCENSYELLYCVKCVGCIHCRYCTDSFECMKCISCLNCSHCYECWGLVNKSYCIRNKQYTKEEYESILLSNNLPERTPMIKASTHVHRTSCENYVGSDLSYTKNAFLSFDCSQVEDVRYCDGMIGGKDMCDVSSFGDNAQMCYECTSIGHDVSHIFFSNTILMGSSHIWYSYLCSGCHHCFGCVGLVNQSYCIFNKQYSKEDYEHHVAAIVQYMQATGERGEFPGPETSMFGYNETIANIWYPLEKQDAIDNGFQRTDYEYHINVPNDAPTIAAAGLPDIEDVTDSILEQVIICEESGKPFRLVQAELDFYRRNRLPLPMCHPDVRYLKRMNSKPGRKLYLRQCDVTDETMLSVYPPGEKKDIYGNPCKIYSEDAYEEEVYG